MRYLKIKDSVDLKELEKFGFEHSPMIYTKIITRKYNGFCDMEENEKIFVEEKSRKISIKSSLFNKDIELCTIYDLIKADIVEVVEE